MTDANMSGIHYRGYGRPDKTEEISHPTRTYKGHADKSTGLK